MRSPMHRVPVLIILLATLCIAGAGEPLPAVGECIEGQYKIYDGQCKQPEKDSGSCTDRYEQTPPAYWCCCDDGYRPEPPCAAEVAAARTEGPATTTTALYAFREKVLERSAEGRRYVQAFYRFSDDLTRIMRGSPALLLETARVLETNLELVARLSMGQPVAVESRTMARATELIEAFHESSEATPELRRALRKLRQDLEDPEFLARFGVRVVP